MSAGLSLQPQFLPASAEICHLSRGKGGLIGFLVHIRHHQHFRAFMILHDHRNQPIAVQLKILPRHRALKGICLNTGSLEHLLHLHAGIHGFLFQGEDGPLDQRAAKMDLKFPRHVLDRLVASAEDQGFMPALPNLPQLLKGRYLGRGFKDHHRGAQLRIFLRLGNICNIRKVCIDLLAAETVRSLLHHVHIVLPAHIQEYGAGSGVEILLYVLQPSHTASCQDRFIHGSGSLLYQTDHRLVILIILRMIIEQHLVGPVVTAGPCQVRKGFPIFRLSVPGISLSFLYAKSQYQLLIICHLSIS